MNATAQTPLYPTRPIELTVVRVEGGGNTGGGRYFFSFRPNIVLIREPTYLHYKLSETCSPGLVLDYVVGSASAGQLQIPRECEDSCVTIVNHCIARELLNLAFVVRDNTPIARSGPEMVICDPQVLNVPE
ncbi:MULTISPECIES: hypothetical protein [Lysobacter]|uniref:Uncharacterized protein n=1 Tax=Lysobacter yananisis TaxID=1003114 RepID=A0ABY9PA13_9GAMM|nr:MULTISPECIES: hypothetical protein [Lysobacter]QQQ00640.1 hypothetical protein JHW41_21585 [Lysobacter enzymogenes]UZW60086.1 hypothetical protein BV903_022895 [Lysobacter enzymogenes]WMT03923.1 hypothetical protein RDV84_03495 [Lysobacter yananisis]